MVWAVMKIRNRRAWLVAAGALVILGGIVVAERTRRPQNQAMLDALWADYKAHDWEAATGRAFDNQNGGVTTSEGQSYTMLRAVWENDQETFAKTWGWTRVNLQRPDRLLSWRWGRRADGSMGVLTAEGGQNTASDADSDAAWALLMAGARWHQASYAAAGRAMLAPIWNEEVATVQGAPVLAADNLEKTSRSPTMLVNPSYFSPAAYRVFAREDKAHDWQALATNSYAVLRRAGAHEPDAGSSAGMPPDWVAMDRHTGALQPPGGGKSSDFGFDAMRAVWRTALDAQWNDPRPARQALGSWGFLGEQWQQHGRLAAVYGQDGSIKADYPSVAIYGGTLGYFQFEQPAQARAVVRSQIMPLYDPHTGRITRELNYYDNNWAWFGLALYSHALPDLDGGAAL